ALVLLDLAQKLDRRLLAHLVRGLPDLGWDRGLRQHGLGEPRPVADDQELELAAAPLLLSQPWMRTSSPKWWRKSAMGTVFMLLELREVPSQHPAQVLQLGMAGEVAAGVLERPRDVGKVDVVAADGGHVAERAERLQVALHAHQLEPTEEERGLLVGRGRVAELADALGHEGLVELD